MSTDICRIMAKKYNNDKLEELEGVIDDSYGLNHGRIGLAVADAIDLNSSLQDIQYYLRLLVDSDKTGKSIDKLFNAGGKIGLDSKIIRNINPGRTFLQIQNLSDEGKLYLNFGKDADYETSMVLYPGDLWSSDSSAFVRLAVYGISDVEGLRYSIFETHV